MAAAPECNISFKIDYTSSSAIDSATAYYNIPGNSPMEYPIPSPESNKLVKLPVIQVPGTYDLNVKLFLGNISAERKSSFKIGMCASCEKPSISNVLVEDDGQVVLLYKLDDYSNLVTVEYQIAKDSNFQDIIYSKKGVKYSWPEKIDMNKAQIPIGDFYIRVRKYCAAEIETGVSDWSDVAQFTTKEWIIQKPVQAFCLPGKYDGENEMICQRDESWKRWVILSTPEPKIGSQIYLKDAITLAVPGNLEEFDIDPFVGFNKYGIRWIRFPDFNMSTVYGVNPKTGIIIATANITC
ncbi:hypothetical protein ACQ7CX_09715 [Chryseobacterium arthrosphaerae]|uniref:hypothetical protein n=1 Tax=Chryseobacterium arthrosphaerae TaxID=651561 RepID=UPI001BB018FE|nr:hypothetical protein [Chryseobacterium arthrosphaerae]QUY53720.1 hypothetical protein I2F65_12570 [Chryseobacterium arthrosphaerae]